MRALIRLIGRFRRDRRGNIAVIFALALLPLLSAVGCAVDYSLATRMKAKMQSAADAAAVASISQNSAGFIAAAAMSSNGSVAAGVTDANNVFNGNIKPVTGYSGLTLTSTVTKTGATLTSLVQFSANVPVVFMKVLGYQTLTVTGSSSATSSLPLYIDFYMTLDVSGSMGLPSTPSEALRMQAINPDNFVQYPTGCTLPRKIVRAPIAEPSNTPQTIIAWAMYIRALARPRSAPSSKRRRPPAYRRRRRLACLPRCLTAPAS